MAFSQQERSRRCYLRKKGFDIPRLHGGVTPKDFWVFVDKLPSGCWEWTSHKNTLGYGMYWSAGQHMAHRWSWSLVNGPIPEGKIVMHLCDNPPCVNPEHLRVGTQLENRRDAVNKDRQAKGVDVGTSKLKPEQVLEIRRSVELGERRD